MDKKEFAKQLIKEILEDNYINQDTQFTFGREEHKKIVAMRHGVKQSCISIIGSDLLSEYRDELAEYAREVIKEIEQSGKQEVSFK